MARLGYAVVLIDIRFHDSHDITKVNLQQAILGWIRAKHVLFCWMGVLCKSWSRARNMPGGPAMLRNADNVLGLDDIRLEAYRQKVRDGNGMMAFAARVMRACTAVKIGAAIENPWSSWIWRAAPFVNLLKYHGCRLARTDFCMWGTAWQKGTGILTNADPGVTERRCVGCPRGLCARTGLRHIELKGQAPDGRFLTSIAEPYPRSLCRAFATMANNYILSLQADKIAGILDR